MPFLCSFLFCSNVVTFAVLITFYSQGRLAIGDMKSLDIATIALTSATLVVAVVGAVVAVVTFVGYREIRAGAARIATKVATKVAADVAQAVATRTAIDAIPSDTPADEAEQIKGSA
jgi:hypothetical protein